MRLYNDVITKAEAKIRHCHQTKVKIFENVEVREMLIYRDIEISFSRIHIFFEFV